MWLTGECCKRKETSLPGVLKGGFEFVSEFWNKLKRAELFKGFYWVLLRGDKNVDSAVS